MNQNKILAITIIAIIAVGLLWITKPWQKPQESSEGAGPTVDFSYSVDNQDSLKVHFTNESSDLDNDISSYYWSFGDGNTSTSVNPTHTYSMGGTYTIELTVTDSGGNSDNYARSLTVKEVPQGHTSFRYAASFQYLSSEDNEPIGDHIYIVYPCPTIDNKPVVANENFTWQLLAHYIENGENVWQVEVGNGIPVKMVEPRENAPWIGSAEPAIENTSHGPKVWLHPVASNFPDSQDAMFQSEIYRIETEFLVPDNQADNVTLIDNQNGVYVGVAGYSGDNYKPIRFSMEAKLSQWADTNFMSVETYSLTTKNLFEGEWVDMQSE